MLSSASPALSLSLYPPVTAEPLRRPSSNLDSLFLSFSLTCTSSDTFISSLESAAYEIIGAPRVLVLMYSHLLLCHRNVLGGDLRAIAELRGRTTFLRSTSDSFQEVEVAREVS